MIPQWVLDSLDWLATKVDGLTGNIRDWNTEQKEAREKTDAMANAVETGQAAVDAMMASFRTGTTDTENLTQAEVDADAASRAAGGCSGWNRWREAGDGQRYRERDCGDSGDEGV